MQFERGPHILAALICETVIERKDSVLSLINIVDRFVVQAKGADPPVKMPPHHVDVNLVLKVRTKQGVHIQCRIRGCQWYQTRPG